MDWMRPAAGKPNSALRAGTISPEAVATLPPAATPMGGKGVVAGVGMGVGVAP